MGNQVVALEDETDGVVPVGIPVPVFKFFGGGSVDDQVSGCVLIQSSDDVQQCSFSTARWAEDRNKFIFTEFQINAF